MNFGLDFDGLKVCVRLPIIFSVTSLKDKELNKGEVKREKERQRKTGSMWEGERNSGQMEIERENMRIKDGKERGRTLKKEWKYENKNQMKN